MKSAIQLFFQVSSIAVLITTATADESVQQPLEVSETAEGVYSADWLGAPGRTYFMQSSNDMKNWLYEPFIDFGDGAHNRQVESGSDKLFLRLLYADYSGIDSLESATGADFDFDALSNAFELNRGYDPFDRDSDNDGMLDGWEFSFGFNPANAADGAGDADGDDWTNAQESGRNSDPKDFFDISTANAIYKFEEMAGTVATDGSNYTNDGTIEGGATWIDSFNGGRALMLDGIDDRVVIANDVFDLEFSLGREPRPINQVMPVTGPFSIAFWFNVDHFKSGDYNALLSSERYLQNGFRCYVNAITPGQEKLRFSSGQSGGTAVLEWGEIIQPHTWYHVAVVYDGDHTSKMYVNGELVVTDDTSTIIASQDNKFYLGFINGTKRFNGSIDNCYIYRTELSPTQIHAMGAIPTPNEIVLFSEDFELPNVSGSSSVQFGATIDKTKLPSNGHWVGSTQGFGADRKGMINKAFGDYTAPTGNNQGYYLGYANTGITTSTTAMAATLQLNQNYILRFDVARDNNQLDAGYKMELVAFSPSEDNSKRIDARAGSKPGVVLATSTGTVTSNDLSKHVTLSFTPDAYNHSALIGKSLGVRFVKSTNNVILDNVALSAVNLDTDADGMADSWEIFHFGNLTHDGSSNEDGDLLTNLEEFLLGYDPNDIDSDDDGNPDGYVPPVDNSVVFSEDFESPSVSTTSAMANGATYDIGQLPTGGNWILATNGYGSNKSGIIHKRFADYTAPAGNNQGYYFGYTNSGITTSVSAISQILSAGATYTLSFDVTRDNDVQASNYVAELVAFSGAEDDATRISVIAPKPGFVLASTSGSVTSNDLSKHVTLVFVADANTHAAQLNKSLGIRFMGNSSHPIIDNVKLKVEEPLSGLVAHFALDETSGTIAADSSGNGNDGTLINGPVFAPNEGVIGGALQITSSTSHLKIPSSVVNGKGNLSYSIWYRTTDPRQTFHPLLSGYNASNASEVLYALDETAGTLRLFTGETVSSEVSISADIAKLTDGEWHHYVIVRDQTAQKMIVYIDGVHSGESVATLTNLQIDQGGLLVGQKQSALAGGFINEQRLHGDIDELRVYNSVITADEVADLYTVDSDEDGVSDKDELLAGTDPNKADNPLVGLVIFTPSK